MPTRVRSIHFEPDADGTIRRAQVIDEYLVEDLVGGEMIPSGKYVEPRTVITDETHPAVFAALRAVMEPQAAAERIATKRQERSDALARAETARLEQAARKAEIESKGRIDPFNLKPQLEPEPETP